MTGLLPEDIVLDAPIPHIIITSRKGNGLKTRYRKRVIPLVGFALEAMQKQPEGFIRYHREPDNLTATVNKYLDENKLLETAEHSVYSLRHSFQDRLLAAQAPDRVQADLMGHKFDRPDYGAGASLEQKLNFLIQIRIKCQHR